MKLPPKVVKEITGGRSGDQAGYIYPDGILVRVRVELKHRGKPSGTKKGVWYVCPGEIRFAVNQKFDGTMPTRYVVHDTRSLLDGVTEMRMYWDNLSERDKRNGLLRDSLSMTTASGAIHRFEFLGFPGDQSMELHGTYNGNYTTQKETPNFAETVESLRDDNDVLEIVEITAK